MLAASLRVTPDAFVCDVPMVVPAPVLFIERRLASAVTFHPLGIAGLALMLPSFPRTAGLVLPFAGAVWPDSA